MEATRLLRPEVPPVRGRGDDKAFAENYRGLGLHVVHNTGPKTFSAADLLAKELPAVKWAIPGIVPEGVTILAGKPKLGKSWLALDMCIAVAAGGYAFGTKRVEQGSALYLGLEDNERRIRRRLQKRLVGSECPPALDYATEWPQVDEGGVEWLKEWLESHPDARLIVADTLKKIRPRTAGNRSIYDVDYEALEPLIPLAGEYGIAIVCVHHTRKLAAADPLDEISGSTGLSGGADGVLILKRERGRADAFLHVTGREIEEEQELALRWDQNLASWSLAGDADEYRQSEERRKIIELLERTGVPMGPKDIAEVLDKNRSTVRVMLLNMKQDGQVIAASEGGYTVPNHKHHKQHKQEQHHKQHKHAGEPDEKPGVQAVYGVYGVYDDSGGSDSSHLTQEEVLEVQRLRKQGMSPKAARREVLGKDRDVDEIADLMAEDDEGGTA
jgi:hypothetical protein